MFKGNYHTHTYRCKHASGDTTEYAKTALAAGLEILGMSDHTPLPDNRWLEMRMDISELEDYVNSIEKAKQSFPQLTILKGMECEYIKEYHSYYSEELLGKYKLDFLSASPHYYPYKGELISGWAVSTKNELASYAEYIVQMMNTGFFDYVAHPDIFGGSYHRWDEEAAACSKYIFEAAKTLSIPLEINANGFRKGKIKINYETRYMYPWEPFWELASHYNVPVIINSDAHSPKEIISKMDQGFLLVRKYHLTQVDYTTFCNKKGAS